MVDNPRDALWGLADAANTTFEHLRTASDFTADQIRAKSEALSAEVMPDGMSIVVFGSWARAELTTHSDDDWAVIVKEPFAEYDADVVRATALAQRHLGADDKKPGSQHVFGVPFDLEGLVEHVGLDADTNRNFTRRMLLLLESHELAGTIHAQCWSTVLGHYLNFGIKHNRPPRFLLNDLVRYWRTICVDFEGKHANTGAEDPKWVTRNAKLRTSRKLLFAGGLLPILLCHYCKVDQMHGFLTNWLTAPPTDRLAAAFLHFDAVDEGARMFRAYDAWLAIMQDEDKRAELKRLRAGSRDESELWQEIRQIGEELQRGLNALLFGTDLAPLAPQYAIY